MAKNRVETEILGRSFTIQSEDDEEHIRRVIDFLQNHIKEIKEHYPLADPLKISILASLNLADEIIKMSHDNRTNKLAEDEIEEVNRIAAALIDKLESSLVE